MRSGFYRNAIAPADRSLMNVPFHLPDDRSTSEFLEGAKAARSGAAQGPPHRRRHAASIYNAMPLEGVQALVAYMKDFARRRG